MATHSQTCRGLKVDMFKGRFHWTSFRDGLGIVVKVTGKNVYWTTTYFDKEKRLQTHGLTYVTSRDVAASIVNSDLEAWRNVVVDETCYSYRKAPEYIDNMAERLRYGFRRLVGVQN